MGKRLLIFAIIFLSLLAFTIWRAQPPFRLHRKLLAKLPYVPDRLLITDLDDDGHPEVTAILGDKPPIWVRFPFDKPSRLRLENCWAIQMMVRRCQFVPKALPVWTVDRRLRLLRWKDGKAILEPLPNLPDVPMKNAFVGQGEGTETVFLSVYRGGNVWAFILSPQGEWQFASRFTSQAFRFRKFATWYIADLADLDRDGFWDALCLDDVDIDAWVSWSGRGEETDLGGWLLSGYPRIIDLDGDGWAEIVMVAEDKRLKIWRFDRRERRLKVVAASSPLPVTWAGFFLRLFDLDGDGRKEIVVANWNGNLWVFQWRDGKLKMWKGEVGVQGIADLMKFGDQKALYGFLWRPVLLFPPRIWFEGWRLQWEFQRDVRFSIFCSLPKGEKALSPSNWRVQEAPFEVEFAGDIDGDGSDDVIGYDFRWRRWRLYRAEVTKAGELRWRDVLLGRDEPRPNAFAMLVDGERRGLAVFWEDGRLELLTMESKR
ncbi:MAG: hypothetical protein OGMRLDGQ_002872 [Candidatus Fervidibacter sp.]